MKPGEATQANPATSYGVQLESSMTTPFGIAPRCQAKNRSRAQCARPARRGYRVCSMHGAGTRKREQAGTRLNPRTAPISTGLTAQAVTLDEWRVENYAIQARVDYYRRNKEKLRNGDELLARLWALADLFGQRNPAATPEKTPTLLPVLIAVGQGIERVERIEAMMRKSAVPTLSRREAERLVAGLVEVLHQFVPYDCLDEAVRMTQRLGNRIVGSLDSGRASPELRDSEVKLGI